MLIRILVFLFFNFSALGIGGLFTSQGSSSNWYDQLEKAPWTPPGWVFGAAWTTIMVLFSIYMAYAWDHIGGRTKLLVIYIIQLALNILWNPVFFKYHEILLGLIIISCLTLIIGYMFLEYSSVLKLKSLLIAPYFIWLLIATSLNAYIYFNN